MAYIRNKSRLKTQPREDADGYTPDSLLRFAKQHQIETEPLDLPLLVETLGLTVRYEPLARDLSGSLKKDKQSGRWIITVNSLHHPHRQRFTIAHELAHYYKHAPSDDGFEDTVFFRGGRPDRREIEANEYAAQLLMPADSFHQTVASSPRVEDLARHFQVSSAAVIFRANELGYKGKNE